jgi:hypothetical protein
VNSDSEARRYTDEANLTHWNANLSILFSKCLKNCVIISVNLRSKRLCGIVVRVSGYRSRAQRITTAVNLGSLDRSRYFFIQVAPQLSSRGWVDPVPEPLLLRKSGRAGNQTRDLWIWSQKLLTTSTQRRSTSSCNTILITRLIYRERGPRHFLQPWIWPSGLNSSNDPDKKPSLTFLQKKKKFINMYHGGDCEQWLSLPTSLATSALD